jgi:serine/threonine-protein kinase
MTIIRLPHGQFEYDETQPLGKPGGFGQVFAGRSATDQNLAVKKLHLSAAEAAHRELKIADELSGRVFMHVIQFLDSGEDASSGDYFIVMPQASGSLQDVIDVKSPLGSSETAAILLQIVNGLIEVGELVHRDLKPQNILLHADKWKIADFGIARFVEESTSAHTLRGFLSPYYAAPEQWKQERATHATDVYSLGCIGYCLLTGGPPFTTNPSEEHQHVPVPAVVCDDPRLKSTIVMMLRKLPESRPSLERVRQLLEQMVNAPVAKAGSGVAELAQAGVQIAESESRRQAELEAQRTIKLTRDALVQEAFERLRGIANNLWHAISNAAPAAITKSEAAGQFVEYQLGEGTLWLGVGGPMSALGRDVFRESKWDVITFSQIGVRQFNPQLVWSASLWFARLPGTADYRWYEVSYIDISESGGLIPNAELNFRDADLAVATTVMHSKAVAFGPKAIDDEDEADFQERWLWLLARAASGRLNYVATSPITNWPPSLL